MSVDHGSSGVLNDAGGRRLVATSLGRWGVRLVFCAVSVVLVDWLFYGQPIGWTVALYAALLAVAVTARNARARRSPTGRTLIALVAGLVLALVEYPGALATILITTGIISLAIFRGSASVNAAPRWAARVLVFPLIEWARVFIDLRLVQKWQCRRGGKVTERYRRLIYWMTAGALGLVFVALFAFANPVIVRWIRQVDDLLGELAKIITPERIVLWSFVAAWSWALLRGRASVLRATDDDVDPAGPLEIAVGSSRNAVGLVVRCLLVFNVIFLVQNGLDLLYLFGGAELPEGMTYAQYAHRGAYPLIVAALLAGLFVLTTFRPASTTQTSAVCRRLVYAWLGQTVLLTLSSVWRLSLYVEAFSLTRWRLAAGIWMMLVAVGLVAIILRIVARKPNAWLWRFNALSLLLVIYVGSFVNFDGLIAEYNVRHCEQTTGRGPDLDLEYLERLGPESLPALEWFTRQTQGGNALGRDRPPIESSRRTGRGPADRQESPEEPIAHVANRVADRLRKQLQADLANWRGWSWRRHRLSAWTAE